MKKITGILLLTVTLLNTALSQKTDSCGKLNYDNRIWFIQEGKDTVFCDEVTIQRLESGAVYPSFFQKNNKKVLNNGLNPFYAEYTACNMKGSIRVIINFSEEFKAKNNLNYNKKIAYFACDYFTENNKVTILYGNWSLSNIRHNIAVAVDKNTGEIIDFKIQYNNVKMPEWNKMFYAFAYKHLNTNCEVANNAYKKVLAGNFKQIVPHTPSYETLVWTEAQRQCDGLPNNYDVALCKYNLMQQNNKK